MKSKKTKVVKQNKKASVKDVFSPLLPLVVVAASIAVVVIFS